MHAPGVRTHTHTICSLLYLICADWTNCPHDAALYSCVLWEKGTGEKERWMWPTCEILQVQTHNTRCCEVASDAGFASCHRFNLGAHWHLSFISLFSSPRSNQLKPNKPAALHWFFFTLFLSFTLLLTVNLLSVVMQSESDWLQDAFKKKKKPQKKMKKTWEPVCSWRHWHWPTTDGKLFFFF